MTNPKEVKDVYIRRDDYTQKLLSVVITFVEHEKLVGKQGYGEQIDPKHLVYNMVDKDGTILGMTFFEPHTLLEDYASEYRDARLWLKNNLGNPFSDIGPVA